MKRRWNLYPASEPVPDGQDQKELLVFDIHRNTLANFRILHRKKYTKKSKKTFVLFLTHLTKEYLRHILSLLQSLTTKKTRNVANAGHLIIAPQANKVAA